MLFVQVSPLSNRMMVPQAAKANDMTDSGNVGETAGMSGRVFSPSVVPGMQWRPGSSFQNQNEAVCHSNSELLARHFITALSVSPVHVLKIRKFCLLLNFLAI